MQLIARMAIFVFAILLIGACIVLGVLSAREGDQVSVWIYSILGAVNVLNAYQSWRLIDD